MVPSPGCVAFKAVAPVKLGPVPFPDPGSVASSRDFTNDFGTSKATYVWLPLYVHPTDPRNIQVVWRDEWQLEDASIYPW
jgi:hypothetical protein